MQELWAKLSNVVKREEERDGKEGEKVRKMRLLLLKVASSFARAVLLKQASVNLTAPRCRLS